MITLVTLALAADPFTGDTPPDPTEAPAEEKTPAEPVKVDVKAMFANPPGEGEHRCRSKKPDVVRVGHRYTGGAAPYPGLQVGSAQLIVDGVVVASRTMFAQQPSKGDFPQIEVVSSKVLSESQEYGKVNKTEEVVVLENADGSPIFGDTKRLEVTWVCESVRFPPRP